MSEPFLAEIRIVGFNFAPRGWAFCDGQILPINQNQSLYSLLGTTYGGDGRTSFALPDLRGRAPRHPDGTTTQGQKRGSESNMLAAAEMPSHKHMGKATGVTQDLTTPKDNLLANAGGGRRPIVPYGIDSNLTAMAATDNAGGGQSVNNMQPFLSLNFCIALQGLFPSRN
jgi:microcystin-dependent protein